MIGRLLRRGAWLATAVLVVTCGAVMYISDRNLRLYGQGRGLEAPVDAILVLGAGVDGDGVLGYDSRRRVAPAVDLLQAGRSARLIFSGSVGDTVTKTAAAALMRDYALSLGAPADRLIVEPDAHTTFENLRFGFAIAEAQGFRRLAILSDAYHLERARALAAFLGHPEIALVAADGLRDDSFGNRVWSILREAMAWWYNLAKVGGWRALGWAGLDTAERERLIR
jgi:uncharacterized SAM-binding protein YcdF (DUF218 family)